MENKTKADPKTVKGKAKTDLLVCIFGCFAGNGAVHSRQEGEEGRKPLRISPRFSISRRRVNPRAASCPPPLLQFLRASYAVPGLFRDLFVIVTCLNMFINYC